MSEKKNLTTKETFALAFQNQQKNNLRVAENLYKKVLNVNPDHANANNNLGLIFQVFGELQKAKGCYEKAINNLPNYVQAHNNLGNVFKELGELQKAKSCYEKAVQINPNYADIHFNLGIIMGELGQHKKAKSCYEKAIQINPNHAIAHNNLGIIMGELGHYKKAKSCYEKAVQINPNYATAYNNLGIAFKELGEIQKAVSSYEKALELNPDSINAQANITNIYINQLDNLEKTINESYKTLKILHKTSKFINQKIPLYRLKHDVQQTEYLCLKNYKINGIEKFQKVGNEILSRKEIREDENKKILLSQDEINSLLPFYKAYHIYQTSKISESCINPHNNWLEIEEQYFNSPKQIMYIDNFLSEEAIKELREFCLISKIWNKEYNGEYLGAFSNKGFISPIHIQIAIDLKQKLPKLFGPHRLSSFWGFKYDSTLGKGIKIHADHAIHNLNFWITPDEYNNEKNAGGLKVYDVPAPEDWTFYKYNNIKADEISKFLNDNNAHCTNIPYKFNRAVLFNSAYFHETDIINFKDKYEARRINITYLFGNRLVKIKN